MLYNAHNFHWLLPKILIISKHASKISLDTFPIKSVYNSIQEPTCHCTCWILRANSTLSRRNITKSKIEKLVKIHWFPWFSFINQKGEEFRHFRCPKTRSEKRCNFFRNVFLCQTFFSLVPSINLGPVKFWAKSEHYKIIYKPSTFYLTGYQIDAKLVEPCWGRSYVMDSKN